MKKMFLLFVLIGWARIESFSQELGITKKNNLWVLTVNGKPYESSRTFLSQRTPIRQSADTRLAVLRIKDAAGDSLSFFVQEAQSGLWVRQASLDFFDEKLNVDSLQFNIDQITLFLSKENTRYFPWVFKAQEKKWVVDIGR